MKLSIWQQFSSNHSGGFTVVGKFKSKENVNKATKELRTLIETVRDSRNDPDEVTGYEYAMGLEYGFEWIEPLYWAYDIHQVAQFDNLVIVSDYPHQSSSGAGHIKQMMSKFADEVFLTYSDNVDVFAVELTCQSADIEKAQNLYTILESYFSAVRVEKDDGFPPWDTTSEKYPDSDVYYGLIECNEKQLRFYNMTFMSIGTGLPILIAYLKQADCTDIEYTIEQRDMKEVYGDDW